LENKILALCCFEWVIPERPKGSKPGFFFDPSPPKAGGKILDYRKVIKSCTL
jgi:hypothetical protein